MKLTRAEQIKKEEEELEALMKGEITPEELEEQEETQEEEETTEETTEEETVEEETTEESSESKEELSAEEKNWKKRHGDLRRHAQKEKETLEARIAELESANSGDVKPPASEEELKAWVEQYPDAARIIDTMIEAKASEKIAAVQSDFTSLTEVKETLAREKAEATIAKAHPDFEEIRKDDDFHAWAAKQPDVVQKALYDQSEDPDSVIFVLDTYKKATGKTPEVKKEVKKAVEKEAAKAVSKQSASKVKEDATEVKWSESKVHKLSDADYMKYSDEIDEAIQSGKFLYDMQ